MPTFSRVSKSGLFASRREEIIEKQYDEIKLLETKYRTLYEESPVMFRTINTDGIILDCNRAYLSGLGYSTKAEVIGHSIFEHTPSDALNMKRESFEEWRRTGTVKNKEVWFKRNDGSNFPALISANNLYDGDGNLVGSNTVITDMTEIYGAREQVEKANKMREEFIRIASHELRSPIQPILLASQLAKENKMNNDTAWDLVIRESKRLKRLSEDILDVSRIEAGNLSYEMQKLQINEIISEVIEDARLLVQENDLKNNTKSVIIESKRQGGDEVELCLDRCRITQALANIVNNSIKFTKEGLITVETRRRATEKIFEIRIIDTGTGIHPEILPKLFNKFATRTNGESALKQGTGLGLFISKSIINAHGGDVSAYNNDDGKGATFVITLPVDSTTRE